MDNIQQNIQRANLKKKNIARLVLYSELSKYYTMEEIDQMLATISESGFVDLRSYLKKSEIETELSPTSVFPVSSECLYSVIQGLTARIEELERKVEYYHPEGVTITVSPQTVYVGQSAQIEIIVSTTFLADNIKLYRGNVEISHVEESTGFTYTDTVTPSTTDAIVYRVEAQIGGEVKRAEKAVTVEEAVIIDYYVGWTTGTKTQFASKTDAEMIEGATGYSSLKDPSYTRAFGDNNIFYLMYQTDKIPQSIIFTSGNIPQPLYIDDDNTCPHADVVIDGITYKVFGNRLVAGYDPNDSIRITF